MGDFPMNRSMDDFLINPTIKMDDYCGCEEPSGHSGYLFPVGLPSELVKLQPGSKTPEPTATIQEYADIPILWQGYTSEEEVASPIDNDDFSFNSADSDCESAVLYSDGPYHARTCNNAQQLCSRAQAVQVVSVGKAKVVTMPRLADSLESPKTKDSTTEANIQPPLSRLNRMDLDNYDQCPDAIDWSSRTTSERSQHSPTPSPKPERPVRRRLVRRKPNFSRMQMKPRSESQQTTRTSSKPRTVLRKQSLNFLNSDPCPSHESARIPASPSLSKSKMHKFSSSFKIRGIGWDARRSPSPNSSEGEVAVKKDHGAFARSTLISDMHIPSRTSSKPIPKMIPRGANERAPPIVLPPCPDDYEEDIFVPSWPHREDSTMAPAEIGTKPATLRERRRSLSAFVSTQA